MHPRNFWGSSWLHPAGSDTSVTAIRVPVEDLDAQIFVDVHANLRNFC